MPKSNYVQQPAYGARCSKCLTTMTLLCDEEGNINKPWFYICWLCKHIAQVGKGPVGVSL